MSSVVISGDTSGAITLAVPAVAGTNTATLPAATGTVMVSGNMPAFSAYKSANQTISNNTTTLITFDTENFDTASRFNNTGSTVGGIPAYSFMPNVAGYYQINLLTILSLNAAYNYYIGSILYKTGTPISRAELSILQSGSGQETSLFHSNLVYMNGTTDYVAMYVYHYDYTATTTIGVISGLSYTSFNGTLVRTA